MSECTGCKNSSSEGFPVGGEERPQHWWTLGQGCRRGFSPGQRSPYAAAYQPLTSFSRENKLAKGWPEEGINPLKWGLILMQYFDPRSLGALWAPWLLALSQCCQCQYASYVVWCVYRRWGVLGTYIQTRWLLKLNSEMSIHTSYLLFASNKK